MAKLTKSQSKLHQQACRLLEKPSLSLEERFFVLEHWNEAANHDPSRSGAFFTPLSLASDFRLEIHGDKIIDLCAGIGVLSFCYYHLQCAEDRKPNITCVEMNPEYVQVGRKLLPEANWINADIFDIWQTLPHDFNCAIGNPPFGRLMAHHKAPRYSGPEFEYKIIDIAAHLAQHGAFILPQTSSPFRYSGAPYFDRYTNAKFEVFYRDTQIDLDAGIGIDTSIYADAWKQTSVLTEIACCEFPTIPASRQYSLFSPPDKESAA